MLILSANQRNINWNLKRSFLPVWLVKFKIVNNTLHYPRWEEAVCRKSPLVIVDEVENAYIFGQAIPFLKTYLTDVFALAQNQAALYILTQDDLGDILMKVQSTKQFIKTIVLFFTKERNASICIDCIWEDMPDLDNCFSFFLSCVVLCFVFSLF